MSAVVWRDPPGRKPGGGRSSDFTESIQEELRVRPGKWAQVKTGRSPQSVATQAYHWRPRFPEFEFRSRTIQHDAGETYAVFARFVGDDGGVS